MSEEIIIDGVNVAGCKCFVENTAPNVDGDEFLEVCENVYTESSYCENNKDCTFKQLKRLQAENEELKRENDLLKADQCNKCDFQKQYFSETKLLLIKNKRLNQALEEIREMFDNCCFKANFLNICDSDCKYINKCNGELSVIQKRISEVLR